MQAAWNHSCAAAGIPTAVRDKWFAKLVAAHQLSATRRYNTVDMLERKFQLLADIVGVNNSSASLVMAVCFQYYVYNMREDGIEPNVMAVREFFAEAQVDRVSVARHLPANQPNHGRF